MLAKQNEKYMKYVGSMHGKQIHVGSNGKKTKQWLLADFIKNENRLEYLRELSLLSAKSFKCSLEGDRLYSVAEIGITPDFVRCCAEIIVKNAKGQNQLVNKNRFMEFIQYAYYLHTKDDTVVAPDPITIWILYSYRQFGYQESIHDAIARSFYIYIKIWKTTNKVELIDIENEIYQECGVRYEKLLLLSFLLLTYENGNFFEISESEFDKITERFRSKPNYDDYQAFLSWISTDYKSIEDYDYLNEINPFIKWPVISTGETPNGRNSKAYLIISKADLMLRVTKNMYYIFLDKHRVGKDNAFKREFGYVFENYVGDYLKYYLTSYDVGSFKYKKTKKCEVDSVDWVCKRDHKLILIEVKQSSIYFKAKSTGSIDECQKNLRQTIKEAFEQIRTMKIDIDTGSYPELNAYRDCNAMGLVVIYDSLYSANSIFKEIIEKETGRMPLPVQIINVAELEILLDAKLGSDDLFSILEDKNSNDGDSKLDFKEYMVKRGFEKGGSKFLNKYFKEIVA